jgi:putative membrane protein
MIVAAKVLVFVIALLHVYILVLEMFLWRTRARRIFGMSEEQAETTATLAKNQGLYNGFLAAGLFWAGFASSDFASRAYFFLACVLIAGVYGGVTANRRILYIQALPAAAALAAVWFSQPA